METGGKSTESRRMRVRVINLNPKMAEEKELHKTLKLLRKRKPAEAVGDHRVTTGSVQMARIGISQGRGRSSGKQGAWYPEGGRVPPSYLRRKRRGRHRMKDSLSTEQAKAHGPRGTSRGGRDEPRGMSRSGQAAGDEPRGTSHSGRAAGHEPRGTSHSGRATRHKPRGTSRGTRATVDEPWWMSHRA